MKGIAPFALLNIAYAIFQAHSHAELLKTCHRQLFFTQLSDSTTSVLKKQDLSIWPCLSLGAGEGNRTLTAGLGSLSSTTKLHLRIDFILYYIYSFVNKLHKLIIFLQFIFTLYQKRLHCL